MTQLFMRRPNLLGLPSMPCLPDGFVLRKAGPGDVVAIAETLARAFEHPEWNVDRVRTELLDDPFVAETLVVCRDDVAVATASVLIKPDEPLTGILHWVATHPSYRGLHLGRTVSLAVLHEFARRGCRDAVLLTDDTRLPAIATYLSLGFVPEPTGLDHCERWQAVQDGLIEYAFARTV